MKKKTFAVNTCFSITEKERTYNHYIIAYYETLIFSESLHPNGYKNVYFSTES